MFLLKKSIDRQVSDLRHLVGMEDVDLSGSGADPGGRGLSRLHYAAWYNLPASVDLLLSQGADVMARDVDGATPLHYAARYKHRFARQEEPNKYAHTVVERLLHGGAEVNDTDRFGSTPLFFAVIRGNEDAAEQLIEHSRCDVNAADRRGSTCLHLAAKYDRVKLAVRLLEVGARLEAEDDCGITPLHIACMEGHVGLVRLFIDTAGKDRLKVVNALALNGTSPLDFAVEKGVTEAVRICLQNGAVVDKACRDERASPLHLAACSGNTDVVSLLLDTDPSLVKRLDGLRQTPLHWAVRNDKFYVADMLLQNKAALEAVDSFKMTPLLCACVSGSVGCLRLLLERGADVTALSTKDQSAVHLAAINNKKAVLSVLMDHLSEVKLLEKLVSSDDRIGNSPLHYAAEHGFIEIAKTLLENGADPENKNEDEAIPLHIAAKCGRTGVVREILTLSQKAAIVLNEDEDSNTPLHLAAARGHAHACELLLEKGANLKDRNRMLWTPLCAAANGGWTDTLRVLLRAGADLQVFDRNMDTAAHLAAKAGYARVIRLLLHRGASMASCNEDGFNPLDMAIEFGHKDVAMAIVSSDHWKDALRNRTGGGLTDTTVTPMRKLALNMPEVAVYVMNRCITTTPTGVTDVRDPKLELAFDFEFTDDTYTSANWGGPSLIENNYQFDEVYGKEGQLLEKAQPYTNNPILRADNHVLKYMVSSKRAELLYHPLVLALIKHKWQLAQVSFFSFLLYYVAFVALVTTYMTLSTPPYMLNGTTWDVTSEMCRNVSDFHLVDTLQTLHPAEAKFAGMLIWAFAGLGMLIEVVQAANVCWHYVEDPINVLDWFTYLSWTIVVIPFHPCYLRTDWQWQLGSVAMFATWINLILFLRRMPLIGIFYVMVGQVSVTFLKFFIFCFSLFLFAFSFTFFVLLRNQEEFSEPQSAFVKVFVMMIGELEFSSVFHGEKEVAHRHITTIIFLTFLCMVTIVIMNLLTGLAVGDVEAVQEQARVKKLAMQIDLILEVEMAIPEALRRRLRTTVPTLRIRPNKIALKLFHKLASFLVGPLASRAIAEAVFKDSDKPDPPVRRRHHHLEGEDGRPEAGPGGHHMGSPALKGLAQQNRDKLKLLETKMDKMLNLMQTLLQRQDEAYQIEDQED